MTVLYFLGCCSLIFDGRTLVLGSFFNQLFTLYVNGKFTCYSCSCTCSRCPKPRRMSQKMLVHNVSQLFLRYCKNSFFKVNQDICEGVSKKAGENSQHSTLGDCSNDSGHFCDTL